MSNPLWCGASADARYGRVRLPGAACHGLRCTIPIEHRSERGAEQARATASRLNRESSGAQSRPRRVAIAHDATPVASLAGVGLFAETHAGRVARRIAVVPLSDAGPALASVAVIFEAVPEVLDLKRDASARASVLAGPKPIIASTTSTIMVDEMAGEVERTARFPRRPLAQSSLSRPAG
jgi:3-hydroxyacyl-CoA dehydrogenase